MISASASTVPRDALIFEKFLAARVQTKNDSEAHRQIAPEFHLSEHRIRRIVGQHKKTTGQSDDREVMRQRIIQLEAELEQLKAAPEPAVLPNADDRQVFAEALARFGKLGRYLRVHVVSDEHFPDEDERAIAMNVAVNHWFQPDLTILNGDQFDFNVLSTHYAIERDQLNQDAFKTVRAHYMPYVEQLGGLRVFLNGNHNARLQAFTDLMWQFGDSLEESYAALVRSEGKVLYMGTQEEVDVGPLHVQHGTRTGVNAAKNALMNDLGGANSSIQGHTHGVSIYYNPVKVQGEDRYQIVSSIVAGFAGKRPPRYLSRRTNLSRWIWASTVYHVNLHGGDVHPQPILYHETERGGLVAFCGQECFQVSRDGKALDADLKKAS